MQSYDELLQIISGITNTDDLKAFLEEILTPGERGNLSLRWQLMKELHAGVPQRKIAARHHISLCKITRGSKILKTDNSMTRRILDQMSSAK